jgi:hypothetical protein
MPALAWQITMMEQRNPRPATLTFFSSWLKLCLLRTLTSGEHSPSLATLRKYARAVGFRLEIHLVRAQAGPNAVVADGEDSGWRVRQQPQHRSGVVQPQPPNRRTLAAKTIAGAERCI